MLFKISSTDGVDRLLGTDLFAVSLTFTQRVETQERTEAEVKHSRTKGNSQDKIQQLPQTEEGALQDMEILSHPTWMEEKDENMADEEETYSLITPTDLPGKTDLMCECAKW